MTRGLKAADSLNEPMPAAAPMAQAALTGLADFKKDKDSLDLARFEVRFTGGERAELSDKEAELLRYLAGHAGRAISRDELLRRVWQIDPKGVSTRTIDMHITRLREKLHDDSEVPRIVLTVRGKGYMFAGNGAAEVGK